MSRTFSPILLPSGRYAHLAMDNRFLTLCGLRVGKTVLGEPARKATICRYCKMLLPLTRPARSR